MSIQSSTIRSVNYPPEILASADITNLVANSEASPPLLNLSRIDSIGVICQLLNVGIKQNANVSLRFRYDKEVIGDQYTTGLFDLGTPNNYLLSAVNQLYFNLYSQAIVANYQSNYGLKVIRPNVAEKIKFGISLSPIEAALAAKYNINDLVQKGNLPLQFDFLKQREYQKLDEVTYAWNNDVPTSGAEVITVNPRNGQFLVLEKLSADTPALASDNTHLIVDRDPLSGGEVGYLDLITYAMGGIGYDIDVWVPATNELRIYLTTGSALSGYNVRVTIGIYQLNDVLRLKWGLPNNAPQELVEKVGAGLW